MGEEIDRLEVKVEAEASKANQQLDKLVGKLDKISSSLGSVNASGLQGLASGVQRLASSMQGMKSVGTADFTRLSKNITQLGNINTAGLNSASSSMLIIGKSLGSLGKVSENAMQVGELAKSLSRLGNKGVTNAITNIPKLADALNKMMGTLSRSPQVSKNLIQMTNALSNLASQGSKVSSATKSINNSFKSYTDHANKATKSSKSFASAVGMLYARFWMLRRAIGGLGKSIESSMDFLETVNYFEVAIGKIGKDSAPMWKENGYSSAEEYVDSFSGRLKELTSKMTGFDIDADGNATMSNTNSLGLNPDKLMQNQAVYAQMADSLGLCGETAINTSKAFTMLGADWASLRNISLDTAWEKFASAMAGQSRAVRSLGIDITMATLQETAYKYGLTQAVQEMNQATKAQLRLLTIMNQSAVAFGDMANTINSPANQLRILSQNFANLSRIIGNLFLPVITKVLPYINGLVVAIQRLFTWIGSLLGIKFESINSAIGGVGGGIGDAVGGVEDLEDGLNDANSAAKKLKTTTLGIDELNIIEPKEAESGGGGSNKPSGGGSGILDMAIADALAEYEKVWDDAFKRMDNKTKQIADNIASYFGKIWKAAENTRVALKNLWNDGFKDFANFSMGTLKDFYSEFLVSIGKWILGDGLPRFFDITNDMLKKINWGKLRKSLKDFYGVLEKFAEFSFKSMLDFYDFFLKPIGVWTMNKALPFLLDTITNLANKINWNALNNALAEFYSVLGKFAVGIGQGMINFFEMLTPLLTPVIATTINVIAVALEYMFKALNMIPSSVIEGIGFALATLLTAFVAYKSFGAISAIIVTGFTAIKSAFETFALAIMCHPIIALASGIAVAMGIIVSCVKKADEELSKNTIEDFGNRGEVALSNLQTAFSTMVGNISASTETMKTNLSSISDTKASIDGTKTSIDTIGDAIAIGAYSVDEKVGEIKTSFEKLLGDTTDIFGKEYDVIVEGLAGSLGDTLGAMGIAVPELTSLLRTVRDSATTSITDIRTRMDELDTAYENGEITADDYGTSILELYSSLNKVLGDRSAVDANIKAMEDLKGSVNFSEWVKDGALDVPAMQGFFSDMSTTFNNGRDDINTSTTGIKDGLQDFYNYANTNHLLPESELKTISDSILGTESNRNAQISEIGGYATQVTDKIQNDLIGGIAGVVEDAKARYGEKGWAYKLVTSESEYVSEALGKYQAEVVDPITKEMSTMFEGLGINCSPYASDAGKEIIESLFDVDKVSTGGFGPERTITKLKSDWEYILKESTKGLPEQSAQFGKDTVGGFNKGIAENYDSSKTPLENWMAFNFKSIHDGKMRFGSPSEATWDFGFDAVLGFNYGIDDNSESTKLVIDAWANRVIEQLNASFGENFSISFFETAFSASVWTEKLNIWFESIAPFFTLEKWELLLSNTVLSFANSWDKISKDTILKLDLIGLNTKNSIDLQNKAIEVGMQLRLKNWSLSWDNMNIIVTKICNEIQKTVKLMSKSVEEECDSVITKLDEVSRKIASVGSGTAKLGVSFKVQGFAEGGFPNTGELFMARENGISEMVGSIGGRSAVAPNDQIIVGIRQGVYDAVVSAMSEIASKKTEQPIIVNTTVEMDGRAIVEQTDKARSRMGINFSPA